MEGTMNPRLMVPFGIAAFVFCGVFTVRNFTRDPYAEIQAEERQAEERQAERMRAKYASSDAYLLTFFTIDARSIEMNPEGYHRSISDMLGDVILAEMLKQVKPHGINRSYNSYDEEGRLGTITVRCIIHNRGYHGPESGPNAGYSGQIPERIEASVTMQTENGRGAFEGTHEITASVGIPRSMSPYAIRKTQKRKSGELAKALVRQLN
jgi:hypothetical protein